MSFLLIKGHFSIDNGFCDQVSLHRFSFMKFHFKGLQAIRCPPGLAFDLEKQTCDWKWAVKNCDKLTREKKAKPLLVTDEPLCQGANELACGDGICIAKNLFCNGEKDCQDGSDENVCGRHYLTLNKVDLQDVQKLLLIFCFPGNILQIKTAPTKLTNIKCLIV